jgi:CheY-like chemotaxis protein
LNKTGAVVIIEDDEDDQDIIRFVYGRLGYKNALVFFANPAEALAYLSRPDIFPFIVMSDVNMPLMSGYELRAKVFADKVMRKKCIPYIFFTTSANKNSVNEAYELSVQGFFVKPSLIEEWEDIMRKIYEYWMEGIAPHGFGLRGDITAKP